MPNHITNIISFTKKEKELRKAMKGENGVMDFNSIIPMPEELKGTASPPRVVPDKDLKKTLTKWKKDNKSEQFKTGRPISASEQRRLKNSYGTDNWYDWAYYNWSTKWNAYHIVDDGDEITFDTAWATPCPIFEALARKVKGCEFIVEYADEDIGSNCGTLTCSHEDGCDAEFPDDPEEFACRVKGYRPEDLNNEEEEPPMHPRLMKK